MKPLKRRSLLPCLVAGLSGWSAVLLAADTHDGFAGDWYSPPDDEDDVGAIIRLHKSGATWSGHIVQVNPSSRSKYTNDTPCEVCPPPQKGHILRGLQITWNLKESSDGLDSGEILDPGNGKVYHCSMQLIEQGSKLQVRGYVGLSLLGQTQVWTRHKK